MSFTPQKLFSSTHNNNLKIGLKGVSKNLPCGKILNSLLNFANFIVQIKQKAGFSENTISLMAKLEKMMQFSKYLKNFRSCVFITTLHTRLTQK